VDSMLPFGLIVSSSFDAAHKLLDPRYGSGTNLHGHTYKVLVSMHGDELRSEGMLFDHYVVRETINQVVGKLHDSYLNDVPELRDLNTTPEVIARYLWQRLASQLSEHGVRSMWVEIAESATTSARFGGALDQMGPVVAGGSTRRGEEHDG
jgi:6-pyruvoyltetrahydropterin/6-carboxytetrahydropterin synthase